MLITALKTPKVKINPLTAEQRAIRKARTSNTLALRELIKRAEKNV
jgi:hypothetical protein